MLKVETPATLHDLLDAILSLQSSTTLTNQSQSTTSVLKDTKHAARAYVDAVLQQPQDKARVDQLKQQLLGMVEMARTTGAIDTKTYTYILRLIHAVQRS